MKTHLNGVSGLFELVDYDIFPCGLNFCKTLFTSLEPKETVNEYVNEYVEGNQVVNTYTKVTTKSLDKVIHYTFTNLTEFEGLIISFTPACTKYFGVVFFGSVGNNMKHKMDRTIFGLLDKTMHHHTMGSNQKDFLDYLNSCKPTIYGMISDPILREKFFKGELK